MDAIKRFYGENDSDTEEQTPLAAISLKSRELLSKLPAVEKPKAGKYVSKRRRVADDNGIKKPPDVVGKFP